MALIAPDCRASATEPAHADFLDGVAFTWTLAVDDAAEVFA